MLTRTLTYYHGTVSPPFVRVVRQATTALPKFPVINGFVLEVDQSAAWRVRFAFCDTEIHNEQELMICTVAGMKRQIACLDPGRDSHMATQLKFEDAALYVWASYKNTPPDRDQVWQASTADEIEIDPSPERTWVLLSFKTALGNRCAVRISKDNSDACAPEKLDTREGWR
jgi:hypothetical protein